ncbi:hypothetical protein [Phenylobacterium sp.]|uniref:hypothetical protein n=1 Tax=Phenylobacterium sp. TaxID=1871053 RepID=UPI0037C93441
MDQQRRTLLGAGSLALFAAGPTQGVTAAAAPPGRPGEFDFLAGEWRIAHRRLTAPGQWDEFEGEATCWTILDGVGSVEELRIPARDFSGMGLRLLDARQKVWVDHWVNAKWGVLAPPGTTGGFIDGVGVFISDDTDEGRPIKVRGLWDQIAGRSHRWSQSVSRDGGRTWDDNWIMHWTKVG